MNKVFFRFRHIILFLIYLIVLSAAAMFLWNKIVPELFNLPKLNYWQAAGLLILVRIFTGGLRGRGNYNITEKFGQKFHRKNDLLHKWENMTSEQREKFLNKKRESFRHEHIKYNRNSSNE